MASKEKLQEHCISNPHDYQAIIALVKKNSDDIAYHIRRLKIERVKQIKEREEEYEKIKNSGSHQSQAIKN